MALGGTARFRIMLLGKLAACMLTLARLLIVFVMLSIVLLLFVEAIVAIEAARHAQPKEVRPLFRTFDVQKVVVLQSEILDYRHVVEVVSKRCAHGGRPRE